jgi:leader peptidase (prepilin peptidase)/N-methyltransferase
VSADLIAVVVCAAATAVLAGLGPAVVTRLPEPVLDSDAADKIPYAELGARPGLPVKLAIAGAIVGAIVGWQLSGSAIIAAWVYLGAVGVVLGYVDAQTRLLPTRLIAPSYLVLVALTLLAWVIDGDTDDLVRAGLGWVIAGGFYYVMWWIYPRGMGFGDVRLSGLLGIALGFLGWPEFVVGLYSGFLVGGVGGLLLAMVGRTVKRKYPFGPFMLIGAMIGLVWGQSFADWYTSL